MAMEPSPAAPRSLRQETGRGRECAILPSPVMRWAETGQSGVHGECFRRPRAVVLRKHSRFARFALEWGCGGGTQGACRSDDEER